jgi:hypothetical protein
VASLVSLPELKSYLGDAPDSSDDALLTELLSNVQSLFESQTGRTSGSYKDSGTARTEVKDGTGSSDLYLDYPVSTLTSVKLGYDSTNPDETLDVTNKLVINSSSDSRRLSRTDGGRFGIPGSSRYVTVVYDYGADLPESAKLAIKSVCATAYRRRGSEEVKSETTGNFYSVTMIDQVAQADPFWQMAVTANLRLAVA